MVSHFAAQLAGGANIAGRRLHNALRRIGVESYFYYGTGESSDPSVIQWFPHRSFFWRNYAALTTSWRNRRDAPGGLVTSPAWIRKMPIQATGRRPEVVQLHSVLRWLDLPSFFSSLSAKLPVVWTLHDLIPITGGCIYPGECTGFARTCGNCPQQKFPMPWDASRRFFRTKAKWYRKLNLHLVCNSRWTLAQAKRSALGKLARSITMIHYGLDIEDYKPVNKDVARKALGLPADKFIVGFACFDFTERRKGAHLLIEALKALPAKETLLLVLGSGRWPSTATPVETVALGSISNPRLQSLYYSALDVFAMSTSVETFGNVAIEAMACETPVIAYPAGGLADVVVHGETGLLEPEVGSVAGLADMLIWMSEHPTERSKMGKASRRRVVENFSDTLMARRYAQLYSGLLAREVPLRALDTCPPPT